MSTSATSLSQDTSLNRSERDLESGTTKSLSPPYETQEICPKSVLESLKRYTQVIKPPKDELLSLVEELDFSLPCSHHKFYDLMHSEFYIWSYVHGENKGLSATGLKSLETTDAQGLGRTLGKIWEDNRTSVVGSPPLNPNPSDAILQIVLQATDYPGGPLETTIGMSPGILRKEYGGPLHRLYKNILLAHLVVIWDTDPSEFLRNRPPKMALKVRTLPAAQSNIELPSRSSNTIVPSRTLVKEITWFHIAPVLQGCLKLLGTKGHYNHRPMFNSVSIHLVSAEDSVLKALFLFNNTKSLVGFSDRLPEKNSTTQGAQILSISFQHLILQVIQEGVEFLKGVSEGIHHAKYKAMNHPSRFQVEYLILIEDYLNEMPYLLETAIERIRELSTHIGADFELSKIVKDDLEYLKYKAGELKKEAKSSKQMAIDHIAIAQLMRTKILTILASIFIPLSFVSSFFGMNFEVLNSTVKPLSLDLYWKVAIPTTFATIILPLVAGPIYRFFKVPRQSLRAVFDIATLFIALLFTFMPLERSYATH